MNYYSDIRIRMTPEIKESVLMNQLFGDLHVSLVRLGDGKIGISFPSHEKTLGSVLRLHGSQSDLEKLIREPWIEKGKDYFEASSVREVPSTVSSYRTVKRVQCKSCVERLLRRSIKNGKLTLEEALRRREQAENKTVKNPYLILKSKSTGESFRLFIEHGEIVSSPVSGEFSTYGLSQKATIPWF